MTKKSRNGEERQGEAERHVKPKRGEENDEKTR